MGLTNCFKIYYWPGITCAWFLITFIISYLVSVLDGHVYAFFPYINDTGTLPPESCIFGQFLNIGAVLMAISMYIRYRQIDMAIDANLIIINKWWNTISIMIGALACFGVSLVGNFQFTAVEPMHNLGALIAFIIGPFYFIIQTRISHKFTKLNRKLPAHGNSTRMFYLRLFLSVWLLPLAIAHVICSFESTKYFTGKSRVYWRKEDGGFEMRLAGVFTEWILVLFIFIYIATFTKEFKSIQFKQIHMTLVTTKTDLSNCETI